MHILIVVGSRHASTYEIGEAIGRELHAAGHTVEVRNVEANPPIADYDAVVVGSAVYMGSWLPEARTFVERTQEQLVRKPVWLFSSGPLGDDPQPSAGLNELEALLIASGAREHQFFFGKLDKNVLGLAERFMVKVVKAPEGDFRDWERIIAWARKISAALALPPAIPV